MGISEAQLRILVISSLAQRPIIGNHCGKITPAVDPNGPLVLPLEKHLHFLRLVENFLSLGVHHPTREHPGVLEEGQHVILPYHTKKIRWVSRVYV
jgi:hypothetical protein